MKNKDMHAQPDEELLRITARYVAEWQAGKRPLLSAYLARYPHYADAIADFAAYYALESGVSEESEQGTELSLVARLALERVQQSGEVAHEPALTSLRIPRGKRPLSLPRLAQATRISEDLLTQMEQGGIDPRTIPYEVHQRLARTLRQSPFAVQAFLTMPQRSRQDQATRQPSQRRVAEASVPYQADAQLEEGARRSFRQAIEASSLLSPEQKSYWCTILDQEQL